MPDTFLVHDVAVAGPATHALVIGVGDYPHLNGGSKTRTDRHDGMEQLTSPPISARMFASWLLSDFSHPNKPLASVSLLLSEAPKVPFIDPRDASKKHQVAIADYTTVKAAIDEFFRRGDQNLDNLLIFYFCGHGIGAGPDTALLLSDYGANPLNALEGAIDFRRLRLAMAQSKANEQCYFVDACRASTDTLLEAFGHVGQVVIGGGPRDPALLECRAPVFYATHNGFKAFALPGMPTIFTDALLKALRNFAADNEMGEEDWRVSTNKIQNAVEHVVVRSALGVNKRQVPNADDVSNIHLNFLQKPPQALVYVKSDPPEELATASLTYRPTGGVDTPAPPEGLNGNEWALQLPSGSYDFCVTFNAKPTCVVPNSVRPAYKFVNVKVPP